MTSLKWVHLSSTRINSLASLRHLSGIRILSLEKTAVESLEDIKALVNLEVLNLQDTRVRSLAVLENSPKLTTVWLNQDQAIPEEQIEQLKAIIRFVR